MLYFETLDGLWGCGGLKKIEAFELRFSMFTKFFGIVWFALLHQTRNATKNTYLKISASFASSCAALRFFAMILPVPSKSIF